MIAPETINVTISGEDSAFVQKLVETGRFASETEVVHAAMELLMFQRIDEELAQRGAPATEEEAKAAFDAWLHGVVGPVYDRLQADRSSTIPSAEVDRFLAERQLAGKKVA